MLNQSSWSRVVAFLVLCTLCASFAPDRARGLRTSVSMRARPSARELEAVFVGGNTGDIRSKDASLEALLPLNPTKDPGLAKNFNKVANGLWRVNHAPHIRALEKLLFTSLDVYYELQKDEMFSYVKFNFFGLRGHLCASGSYSSVDAQTCTIEWENIWTDFGKEQPSRVDEVDKHWLPSIIQPIGKAAFIQGVSVFPISYLSKDLIVFTFKLLGTKIVARKA